MDMIDLENELTKRVIQFKLSRIPIVRVNMTN